MASNIQNKLKTDTSILSELISDIENGEIKIPKFQRKFVWEDEQAITLLDSISKSYPIGSLLLWKTVIKLSSERNIGNFKLPHTKDLTPTQYVLDGQQRLTVIYSCLGAPENEEGFAAGYDLENEIFIPNPDTFNPRVFPLRRLYHTTNMLNFRNGLQTFPNADILQSRLDAVINSITNYRIPVVILKDLTLDEVCPIFERINSSGVRLSIYDLMVAATWSPEFDLDDEVVEIKKALKSKRFDTIEDDTILKCLAAIQYGSAKKDSIIDLRKLTKLEMEALVERTDHALLLAIDLLSTEFGIISWDFLPYEAFLIIIAYIYSKNNVLDSNQVSRIKQWFWKASFNERYRVGGENFISRDLEIVSSYVINNAQESNVFGSPPSAEQLILSSFRSSNSRTKAFILALASAHPHNLTNGAKIDVVHSLSKYNKKEYHHIYPRAYIKRGGGHKYENSLVNLCMLSSLENKLISDANPRTYISRCAQAHGGNAEIVFRSNLLPLASEFDYEAASFDTFIEARGAVIEKYIAELCGEN